MLNEMIAFCGVDCAACGDFAENKCPGCRRTDWKEDDICLPVECCRKKEISVCGECPTFPCDDMKAFYEESESHKKAYEAMKSIHRG
ncbi:MAG: DUF3795 domain-containing protein [Clostridia bacterium]|nr:DUF3795 domain-containing protein [Clostridia bacterium]